ncbi:MAG: cyclic nucleotide-binding domain-containing protein [Chitinivibrionales bacterium]|nr:cyclic nucleotide-binding domain-containing protein [Chitinivibrionales bacterium]
MMKKEDVTEFLGKVPLFSVLSAREIQAISKIMLLKNFDKGQTIVLEEDNCEPTFFVILSGSVHVAVLTKEGRQTILATLKKGEFFGEMAILDGEPRSASVMAAEKCSLVMLYRTTFLTMLQDYPKIAIQMLVEMSQRLRKSNRHIHTLSLMSVYGRVADVLLQIAKDGGTRAGNMIIIAHRPKHQLIAEMAGTSRETVTRVLSQLQKKGYISIDRKKMVILDEEKLYY